MQETAVDNPYGLGALIANGDIVARSILVILLIMSLLTWFIMITKFFDQRRHAAAGHRGGEGILGLLQPDRRHRQAEGHFQSVPRARRDRQAGRTSITRPTRRACRAPSAPASGSPSRCSARPIRSISRMQAGLPVLASVGATAPFVGLLGTVIGIYHALIAIGVAGQASIDKVAGPVGEALDHDRHRSGGRGARGVGLQHSAAPQQGRAGARQPFHARAACLPDLGRQDGPGHGQGCRAAAGKPAPAAAR